MDGSSPLSHAYNRPAQRRQIEIAIKNSRFIATLTPCPDKATAEQFIASLKSEHRHANHNCWAYIAGAPDDSINRGCSDDGEPKGTAGRPMLNVLEHSGLGEIAVVVTRYFGGIKLGTGGLVRAYSQAVQEVLNGAESVPVVATQRLLLSAAYSDTGNLEALIRDFSLSVQEREWQEQLHVMAEIEQDGADALFDALHHYPGVTAERRA